MGYNLAVFSSVNQVNRMKRRLNMGCDYFGMIRAPKCISTGGCSFALRFEDSKLLPVKQVSQELGIEINGIYKEENLENGSKVYTQIIER